MGANKSVRAIEFSISCLWYIDYTHLTAQKIYTFYILLVMSLKWLITISSLGYQTRIRYDYFY